MKPQPDFPLAMTYLRLHEPPNAQNMTVAALGCVVMLAVAVAFVLLAMGGKL